MRFIGFYDYTVILTYLSVVFAVVGIHCSAQGAIGAAALCLLASGVCDAFDGTVARTKKNRTDDEKAFGIQLDSLCDVVSFGVAPAFLCYSMGMNNALGVAILSGYCVCAVIRLAFFNVQEAKRQQQETGGNKYYRGLPVTTSSMIFPLFCLLRSLIPQAVFSVLLYLLPALVAVLFILDFQVKKPDLSKLLAAK